MQDNQSLSKRGAVRALHYQVGVYAQAKLVRVLQGKVLDVAVDIRKDSATFGEHVVLELSAENKKQLWIPEGFAHGFFVLSSQAEVVYKASSYYKKESERSIKWNDKNLRINWGIKKPIISKRDSNASTLKEYIKNN